MDLTGKNAIITGASYGFGLAVAEAFIEAGASLMICARSLPKLNEAKIKLERMAGEGQRVLAQTCDVSSQEQVQALCTKAISEFGQVHILVTNAGVYGPMGAIEDVNWHAWKKAIEINLYGTIMPMRALMTHFKENQYGKIVNLSGGGATSPLPAISAYAASKAAVVRMTETLAGETKDDGITINAVAPGALNTPLQDQLLAAGPDVVGEKLYNRIKQVRDGEAAAPMDKGAALCVFLASDASNGITGRLISAIWDDWVDMPNHLDEIDSTDVYTLRRIIPKERGFEWGEVD